MQGWHGRIALITGGGSGIGRLTALRCAERGADVVIADVAEDAGRAAAEEVDGRFVALDVSDSRRWDEALDEVLAPGGRVDIAHLNAGIATGEADITALTDEQYRRAVGVNIDGVVLGTRAVARRMPDGGAVVATASLGGLVPMPTDPIYSMTKHAVVAFVRSIAPQLSPRGITINAVCPGFADTPLVTPELREAIAAFQVPLLDPAIVADTVIRIIEDGGTGAAWFIQPGRDPAPYEFRGVPGPRVSP